MTEPFFGDAPDEYGDAEEDREAVGGMRVIALLLAILFVLGFLGLAWLGGWL